MLDYWVLKTPAWKSLTPAEVRVQLLLLERYNGSNNGRIGLSIRDAAKFGKVAQGTAKKALDALVAKGFVKRRYKGSFSQKVSRATEYELTHVRYGDKSPTKEFASWKPEKTTVANRMQYGVDLGEMTNESVL